MNEQNSQQNNVPLSEMGQVLQALVQAVVDLPAQVRVQEAVWRSNRLFEVQVDRTDTGKTLGKQGEVLNAIRTLMGAMSTRHERAYEIHLVATRQDDTDLAMPCETHLDTLDIEQTRQLLERVIRKVVDVPERTRVLLTPCNHLSVLEIQVNPTSFGQVLGRRGRTIDALRQVVRAIGGKLHRPMYLHLIDPAAQRKEASHD